MSQALEMTLEDLPQATETCRTAKGRPEQSAPKGEESADLPIELLVAANAYFPVGEGGVIQ